MSRFAQVPEHIMPQLKTKLEWAAWSALALHWSPESPEIFARQETMAAIADLSVDALAKGIKKLREKGLVEVIKTRAGNRYRLPPLQNEGVVKSDPPKKHGSDTPILGGSTPAKSGGRPVQNEGVDPAKMHGSIEQTTQQTNEQTTEQTTEQSELELTPPAPAKSEAQELWDHWRKSHPRAAKKIPDGEAKHLPDALDAFEMWELKRALDGLPHLMAGWDWDGRPKFHFAFTTTDKNTRKKAYDCGRVLACIEAWEDNDEKKFLAQSSKHQAAFNKALARLMDTADCVPTDDHPSVCQNQPVIHWHNAWRDDEHKFTWAQWSDHDQGRSSKRWFALQHMLDNTDNPIAEKVITRAQEEAWRDVLDAIQIDEKRAKDRQAAEEKQKRMEAEYEAAGCPIVELDELPF